MTKRTRGPRGGESRVSWLPLAAAIVLAALVRILLLSFWPWAANLSAFAKLTVTCLAGGVLYVLFLTVLLARSSRAHENTSLRLRMHWAAPPLLAPLVVPALAFLATEPIDGKPAWTVCALSDLMLQDECIPSARWLIVGLSLVPAFGLLMLIWWKLCALTEIRWLFERPWSGLGDDVSQANAGEGVARAAIVILIIVACLVPICYSLLGGISGTGDLVGYLPHSAKATPACKDGDRCKPKTGLGTGSGGISKPPPGWSSGEQLLPGQNSSGTGDHSPGNPDGDAIRDIAAILKRADVNSGLDAVGTAIKDIGGSLKRQDVSDSLKEIRKALDDISAKDEGSAKALGALHQPLLDIGQALRGTKDVALLESMRASLQKIADAQPAAGPSVRLPEVEQSLDRINGTLTGKLVPAMDRLKDIRSALDDVSAKGGSSVKALSELRQSLLDVDQTLRKIGDPAALDSVRATLQKIADAMPAGQSATRIAEVERSLDKISDTLANKVAPAMDGMGQVLGSIDSRLGKEKPSDCFDTKFMARPDSGSALMKAKDASSGQRFRPVKSHQLLFDTGHVDISEDDQQQIAAFLSAGAANAALSIHGLADGKAGKTNEGYASRRALAVADIAARAGRKIVDLQWSVGGERAATIKVVEECR